MRAILPPCPVRHTGTGTGTGTGTLHDAPASQDDVNGLFLILGLVSLVVGAIGIANVTLVTVMERIAEIGLRRSLCAARMEPVDALR